jgi:hypothetical protein
MSKLKRKIITTISSTGLEEKECTALITTAQKQS